MLLYYRNFLLTPSIWKNLFSITSYH